MRLPRRQFLHVAAGAAVLPAVSRTARAQAYPSRPVRVIVGYAPGGGTDIFTRLLCQALTGLHAYCDGWRSCGQRDAVR